MHKTFSLSTMIAPAWQLFSRHGWETRKVHNILAENAFLRADTCKLFGGDERTILYWIFGSPDTPIQDGKINCFLKV
jgi:hypothetical protein